MEKIGCGGIYLSVPGVLSLYSMGQTSGVVLDAGYGHTSVVPVFQVRGGRHGYMNDMGVNKETKKREKNVCNPDI